MAPINLETSTRFVPTMIKETRPPDELHVLFNSSRGLEHVHENCDAAKEMGRSPLCRHHDLIRRTMYGKNELVCLRCGHVIENKEESRT